MGGKIGQRHAGIGWCRWQPPNTETWSARAGCRYDADPCDGAPAAEGYEPQGATGKPEHQRHGEQVLRRNEGHGCEHQQAPEAGAGQVGEIDAGESLLRFEKDGAEKECTCKEGQRVEDEAGKQPPLLRRVGDEKDGVEGDLLGEQIGRHHERTEQQQRQARHGLPIALDAALARAHQRTGQAEPEHGEAHHERAEIRQIANCEDAHDGDLQGNHGARHQADGQIEGETSAEGLHRGRQCGEHAVAPSRRVPAQPRPCSRLMTSPSR